jgi:hypothetical protein
MRGVSKPHIWLKGGVWSCVQFFGLSWRIAGYGDSVLEAWADWKHQTELLEAWTCKRQAEVWK